MIKIVIEGEPSGAPALKWAYQPKRKISSTCARRMGGQLTGEISVKLYRKYKATAKIFGDVDNHLKAIFDGLNKIAFADDSHSLRCGKIHRQSPRLILTKSKS